jgi:hypothetical protein
LSSLNRFSYIKLLEGLLKAEARGPNMKKFLTLTGLELPPPPGSPALSQSLYRPSYPGSHKDYIRVNNLLILISHLPNHFRSTLYSYDFKFPVSRKNLGRDSSVSTERGYGLEGRVRFPVGARDSTLLHFMHIGPHSLQFSGYWKILQRR